MRGKGREGGREREKKGRTKKGGEGGRERQRERERGSDKLPIEECGKIEAKTLFDTLLHLHWQCKHIKERRRKSGERER